MTDFRVLATQPCPPVADILNAIGDELDGPPSAEVDLALDDAARPLFGIGSLGADDQAEEVQQALTGQGFGTHPHHPCGPRTLLLGEVVARRCGHPLLLACVGHEVARRAGVRTSVHSCGATWLLCFRDGEDEAFVSFGAPPDDAVEARRHCSHELAWASLLALEASFKRCGYLGRARHAAELRGHLPVRQR